MAEKHEIDQTDQIKVEDLSLMVLRKTYDYGHILNLNGHFDDYESMDIVTKERHRGQSFKFRRGIALTSRRASTKPVFEIYKDALSSLRKEFVSFLSESDETYSRQEALTDYLASTALGEMLFEDVVLDERKPRVASRLNKIKEILCDTSDINNHIVDTIEDKNQREVMQFVAGYMTDDTTQTINGLRAGRTLFQILSGLDGATMPEYSSFTLEAFNGLIQHIKRDANDYEKLAALRGGEPSNGLKALSYFVPEWLFVCAFPMKPGKIEELLEN